MQHVGQGINKNPLIAAAIGSRRSDVVTAPLQFLHDCSGNASLDRSAERALYDVGKFDPLPAAYERDRADIEFWFELKR